MKTFEEWWKKEGCKKDSDRDDHNPEGYTAQFFYELTGWNAATAEIADKDRTIAELTAKLSDRDKKLGYVMEILAEIKLEDE